MGSTRVTMDRCGSVLTCARVCSVGARICGRYEIMLGETAQDISFLLRACTRGAPIGYLCHTATRCTTSVFNPSPSNYEFRVEASNGAGSVGVGSTSGTPGTSLPGCVLHRHCRGLS